MQAVEIPEPEISRFIFADTRFSLVWLLIRLYIGYEWLTAGLSKFINPSWVGSNAGTAISGFLNGALQKGVGAHPDVSSWYIYFIQNVALSHSILFSYIVTLGEIAVGLGLIVGLFTGIAAFFGSFMNMNYLFAGTISINPIMFLLQLLLILAWRNAGWYGLDRFTLPALGTPWQSGKIFTKQTKN